MAKTKQPTTAAPAPARKGSKLEAIIAMMRRPKGATLAEMAKRTGWKTVSVRGVIYNAVEGRLKLTVKRSTDEKRGTVFTIEGGQ